MAAPGEEQPSAWVRIRIYSIAWPKTAKDSGSDKTKEKDFDFSIGQHVGN